MVNPPVNRIRDLMDHKRNVRHVSVIGTVNNGKTSLTNALNAQAGITVESHPVDKIGDDKFVVAVSLYYKVPDDVIIEKKQLEDDNEYLINLFDSPRHIYSSPEAIACDLRIADGALIVLDYQSVKAPEAILHQVVAERIKPVLFINKLDSTIEKEYDSEDLYLILRNCIHNVNEILAKCTEDDGPLGNVQVSPQNGTVCFGSGMEGWAFTVRNFAKKYSAKLGVTDDVMCKTLWGDNFFSKIDKKWSKDPKPGYVRGFTMFVLDPIFKLIKMLGDMPRAQLVEFVHKKLMIAIEPDELDLDQKELTKLILQRWLPAGDALLQMLVIHLPSPVTSQQYRCEILYDGPQDDDAAVGIRTCDPNGPLMMYISKIVPSSHKSCFYAFGRIFSGVVAAGQKVRGMRPDFIPGQKRDLHVKEIQKAVLITGRTVEILKDCPCGNVCGLVGVDQFLEKTGTITTYEAAHNMRVMRFSVSPVVRIVVEPEDPKNLVSLVEGLRSLNKVDPLVQVYLEESGEHIVAGVDEHHLEECIRDLEVDYASQPLKKSDTFFSYRESVGESSCRTVLAKSPNRHNRFYMTAEPLAKGICEDIDNGKINARIDADIVCNYLSDKHGWSVDKARKIWCFGPGAIGANVLVDSTQGLRYLDEIKDYVVCGFKWASMEGVLMEENMRGVQFNLIDVTVYSDGVHRGGGQIIPPVRRCCYAAQLAALPRVMEPIYLVEIQVPTNVDSAIYRMFVKRRAKVQNEYECDGARQKVVELFLPVIESLGFRQELSSLTGGSALSQSVFDHWEILNEDPHDPTSKAGEIVLNTRKRKGLSEKPKRLEEIEDKL